LLKFSKINEKGDAMSHTPIWWIRRDIRLFDNQTLQADIIEQAASVSLRRAEQVDQSILARAFRGELG